MAKVVVTGATGFIGKYLCRALTEHGHDIVTMGRTFEPVDCDIVYHLACPSATSTITENPRTVMDIILDQTRSALAICPTALFVNASSYGAADIDMSAQGAYNVAKRCMEVYLAHSAGVYGYINYRIPSVYGVDADPTSFVVRCVNGTAYYPTEPERMHYIAHVEDVAAALSKCREIPVEEITLGDIYTQFSSGQRTLEK